MAFMPGLCYNANHMKEEAKHEIARERQMKKMRTFIYVLCGIALLVIVFLYVKSLPPPAGKYDDFAKCISNTSTTFYGAFWCPHCRNQKNEFGSAAQYLPYVECSLPDESGQTQVCIDKHIESYPTWYFPDGSSSTGEQSLETLSEKTGCPLPGTTSVPTSTVSSTPGAASPATAG